MFRRQLARAPLIAAFLLLFCAGCGSGKAPAVPAGTLVLGPQETCDRDLAKSPPDVTVYGADAGDYLADRFSLATGDFNGDGFGDILVGAPLADGPANGRKNSQLWPAGAVAGSSRKISRTGSGSENRTMGSDVQ